MTPARSEIAPYPPAQVFCDGDSGDGPAPIRSVTTARPILTLPLRDLRAFVVNPSPPDPFALYFTGLLR